MPPEGVADLPHADGGMAIFEVDGRIRGVSPALRRLLGRGESERMRRAGDIVIHPDDTSRAAHIHERVEHTGHAERAVLRLSHRQGHWVWVDAELGTIEDTSRTTGRLRYLAVLRDVSDERRRLLSHVVAAREEERVRIADDMHDDTVQAILAIDIKLQQLRRHLTEVRQLEIAEELRGMVRGAAERLREIIFELQPPRLPRGGLAGAVADFATALFDGGETRVEVGAGLTTEPSPEIGLVAYRIVQEALRNVRRHARATVCSVRLLETADGILLNVEDDGVGFDVARLDHIPPGHRGMASIRERAEVAGGRATVESRPGGGTIVSVALPRVPTGGVGAD